MTDLAQLSDALYAVVEPYGQQPARMAAEAAVRVLAAFCEAEGEDPAHEVALYPPGHWGQPGWAACWECGPANWGVTASMVLTVHTGRLVESQHGFDVCFYDHE